MGTQKLQLPHQACVAIEDSPRGLESSKGATLKKQLLRHQN